MSFEFHGPLDPNSPLYQQRMGLPINNGQKIEDLSNHIVSACFSAAKSVAKNYFTINASRQSGKTSLLLQIAQSIKAAGGYACWIDFQWAYGAAPEPAINFMAQQIIAAIPELSDSVKVPDKFDNDGMGFEKWLKKLPISEKKTFVLLIEELGALPLDSRMRVVLLLRGAFNSRFTTPWKQVVSVIFGGIELYDLITVQVSPLYNICENIDLLDLDPSATQSLLASGFEQTGDFEATRLNELSQSIHAQVSGHPYLTQYLADKALDYYKRNGNLPVDIQSVLSRLHVKNFEYLQYLHSSIQKYNLTDITKMLLSERVKIYIDEKTTRRLGLLGVLDQNTNTKITFRNRLIQTALDEMISSDQKKTVQSLPSDRLKVEEETRIIREREIQDLLNMLFVLTCMRTPKNRQIVLDKSRIEIKSGLDLNGRVEEVVTTLFHNLENQPRLKNGCYPLGLFLTGVKASLGPEEKGIIKFIDTFIAQYGLMESKHAVFVSYAWGGESECMVDEVDQAFAKYDYSIIRDKKDLDYKGSIKEFERRIGQGQCVILVISDKYLRSEHCMQELLEIYENQRFCERVFPIVLEDAHIYKSAECVQYVLYWQDEIKKLNKAIKKVSDLSNTKRFTSDLDKYTRIRANFVDLIGLLSDMNTLTPEIHEASGFATLISAVEAAQT
jgi:hypothetical protein